MSEHSDFESVASDADNVHSDETTSNHNGQQRQQQQHDASLTDSDHSLLGVPPKRLNASSPSSVCSTRPLEWDSGADVGYDVTAEHQSQVMSTIERIAVCGLVYNANSTPIGHARAAVGGRPKSNSLVNLSGPEPPAGARSASFEALRLATAGTLPGRRSPMASTLSVSTVVHRSESPDAVRPPDGGRGFGLVPERQARTPKEQKSSESSKESNGTLSSADTGGSWAAKESRDSTNATTDRVHSFEYLPGNTYYNGRNEELEDCSDKEIKQSTMMLVQAMKRNGLTDKFQRQEIFKEIVESFLKSYARKNGGSSAKSTSDTEQSPIRQDFTSQTSNTANTIVNKQTNNQSSTITFTSPITSSRFGDDVDSKYDESSMDSGRHIDLKKCKSKKIYATTNKQKNQSVQCTIQDSSESISKNEITNKSSPSESKTDKENLKSSSKRDGQSTSKSKNDMNKEFKKQMLWFQKNYIQVERENQKLWISYHLSHLKNLEKLCHTHEELKKNWNSYKQKQTTNHKPKFRSLIPVSNSSSDFTSTTKTDSTASSKQHSVDSKLYDTDVESSTTVCNHVHFKKGVLVNEPKSMKKCCENTLQVFEEKQCVNKLKTAWSQTKPTNKTNSKSCKDVLPKSSVTYTVDQPLKPFNCKRSISYDIIFKPTLRCSKGKISVNKECKKQNRSISVACQTNEIPFEPKPSLQEYLKTNRPDYVCRAEERQNILSEIATLRDKRKQLKRDLLITNNNEDRVPPNPLAVKRIMSQREMRKQTEHKYRKCPEVKNKKIEKKRKEEYKTNKIMANIFNKKLQKKTLKGNVDLSNSVSVCSF